MAVADVSPLISRLPLTVDRPPSIDHGCRRVAADVELPPTLVRLGSVMVSSPPLLLSTKLPPTLARLCRSMVTSLPLSPDDHVAADIDDRAEIDVDVRTADHADAVTAGFDELKDRQILRRKDGAGGAVPCDGVGAVRLCRDPRAQESFDAGELLTFTGRDELLALRVIDRGEYVGSCRRRAGRSQVTA